MCNVHVQVQIHAIHTHIASHAIQSSEIGNCARCAKSEENVKRERCEERAEVGAFHVENGFGVHK